MEETTNEGDTMKPIVSVSHKKEVQQPKEDVMAIAVELYPSQEENKYYADRCSCLPPPVFIIFITIVELAFFSYYSITLGPSGPVPVDSIFIYRPDRRYEVWRFILYMVLHAGWLHLLFNLFVQLIVGLPLEMVHGSWRVCVIYLSGVLAGSLASSVFDGEVYLVGASGGVYALLTAHLANVMLNYDHMQFGWMRIIGVFIIAGADVGFAVYDRYAEPHGLPVSYIAHMAGAMGGLTTGLLVLKNFHEKFHEHFLWWTALVVYSACMLFAVLYNIFNIDSIQNPEEIF